MWYNRLFVLICFSASACLIESVYAQQQTADSPSQAPSKSSAESQPVRPLSLPGLDNVFQLDQQIFSGSGPAGKQSFDSLKKMGIKTIISVDGTEPHLKEAKAAGMKYIHIPIGYDGITRDASLSFLRAAKDLKGPVYIHCHHGRHRGPAAAAMVGMCKGSLTKERALEFMGEAGTGKDYTGLWRDVRAFQLPPAHTVLPELVESARVVPMVTAMGKISHDYEELQLKLQRYPREQQRARALALLLREAFHETARKHAEDYDDTFKQWLKESEKEVQTFEAALKEKNQKQMQESMLKLKAQCKQCHKAYRN